MAIPTMLARFDGTVMAQTREGDVAFSTSGPVRFTRGKIAPTLLMAPYLTRDASGSFGPEVSPGVQVIDGEYGPAWYAEGDAVHTVTVPRGERFTVDAGTVIVRMKYPTPTGQAGVYPVSSGGTAGLHFGIHSLGYVNGYLGSANANTGNPITGVLPQDTFMTLVMTWDRWTISHFVDGLKVRTVNRSNTSNPNFASWVRLETTASGRKLYVEGLLLFDERVPDAEIVRISTIPKAWEWEEVHAAVDQPYQAYIAEEPTQNLIWNPLMNGTTGWYSNGASFEPVEDWKYDGKYPVMVLQADNDTGNSFVGTVAIPVTPGTRMSSKVVVRRQSVASVYTQMFFYDGNDSALAAIGSGSQQPPNFEWVEIAHQNVEVPEGAATMRFIVRMGNSNKLTGDQVWFTKPQLEAKPYTTSFCPEVDESGNLLTGYSWSGTPHASASERETGIISMPATAIDFARGAMVTRFKIGERAGSGDLVGTSGYGTTEFLALGLTSTNAVQFRSRHGADTVVSVFSPPGAVQPGEWVTAYAEWDEAHVGLAYGDSDLLTAARTPPITIPPDTLFVGGNTNFKPNGAFDAVLIFDRPLTEAEREEIFNAPAWYWAQTISKISGVLMGGADGGGGIGGADSPVLVGGVIMGEDY